MSDAKQQLVESEAEKAAALQQPLIKATLELKAAQAKVDEVWKRVEALMIENNIKSVKSDGWGSLTIVEKPKFVVDSELLAPRYFKKVPNDQKIRSDYKLEGSLPKGVTVEVTKFITKRLKGLE
jgi:hypothetical protein